MPARSDRPHDPRRPDDPSSRPPALLEADAVAVAVGGTHLLSAVSFRADPGEVIAVRGENGAGKTTLLRVLSGRTRPSSGSVRMRGHAVDERDPRFRRAVGVMIGLPPMAPDLTVRDHVMLVSTTWESSAVAVTDATEGALEAFGIASLGRRLPHEFSSGQTQLFGLALAFVRPFDVLLLDEPEQRLDPGRVELLAEAMLRRRAEGATFIIATHSDALARLTADRQLLLTRGSV